MSDNQTLITEILEQIHSLDFIKPEDFPELELYMDQVTTFMDSRLSSCRRYPEDKILTKTMINNYAKNDLLPSPEKKKYSKDHLIFLVLIYYFKSILSIKDIQTILTPLTEHFFHGHSSQQMLRIYEKITELEKIEAADFDEEIMRLYQLSDSAFSISNANEKEKDFLRLFTLICMLCYDIYLKKSVIERLIDGMNEKDS